MTPFQLLSKSAGLLLLATALGVATAQAVLPIDVEVITEPGVPITAPQQWAQLLGTMDLGRVRLRPATTGDAPGVTQKGTRFKIVAVLNSRGELIIDKKRYRARDRKTLANFFELLAKTESFGEELGRFNLTQNQFRQVHSNLSKVLGLSTLGKRPAELINQLRDKFSVPITEKPSARALLREAPLLQIELGELSTGTALAMALREAGLMLVPQKPVGKPLQIRIEPEDPKWQSWPVGWKPEGSPRELAPQLFEFLSAEIDGYPLEQALEALKPRMGMLVVYDARTLARRGIDPTQIPVKHPAARTYLKRVVDRLLSQARLAGELRVDERGQLFYWITQFGKDSPRAEQTAEQKAKQTEQ